MARSSQTPKGCVDIYRRELVARIATSSTKGESVIERAFAVIGHHEYNAGPNDGERSYIIYAGDQIVTVDVLVTSDGE